MGEKLKKLFKIEKMKTFIAIVLLMNCVLTQVPLKPKVEAGHKTCDQRLALVNKLRKDCEAEMKRVTPRKLQSLVKKTENKSKNCEVELDKVFMQALKCNGELVRSLKKRAAACKPKAKVHVRVHVKG